MLEVLYAHHHAHVRTRSVNSLTHHHQKGSICVFGSASKNGQVNHATNSEGANNPSQLGGFWFRPIQLSFCLGSDPSRPKSALVQPNFPPSFAHGADRGGCRGRGRSGPTPSRCGGARAQQQAPPALPAPVAQAR